MTVRMRRVRWKRLAAMCLVALGATAWSSSVTGVQRDARAAVAGGAAGPAALQTYCGGCHNGDMRSPSGAVLDHLDATRIDARPDIWSRAYRQLQAGAMPPVGARRPDPATAA